MKKISLFASIFSLSCVLMSVNATEQSSDNGDTTNKTNQALSKVQQQIVEQEKSIKQTSNKRSSLENQLRNDDISIAKIVKAMIKTQDDFEDTQQTLKELAQEKITLTHKKQQQEKVLAQQLRAAYTSGHHD
ncbi:peptidase M23, partial [Colwellia sp. BRX8-8]|nr:peptidase M23 [Colwellia sp. BRX8-8]